MDRVFIAQLGFMAPLNIWVCYVARPNFVLSGVTNELGGDSYFHQVLEFSPSVKLEPRARVL